MEVKMKTKLSLLGLVAAISLGICVGLSGCGGGGSGPEDSQAFRPGDGTVGVPGLGGEAFSGVYGSISGVIEGAATRAEADPEITVFVEGTDLTTTPDENGFFQFDQVPVGEHTVSAVANGQNLGAVMIAQVEEGKQTHLGALQLRPAGQIAGLVTAATEDGSTRPVPRARVMARPLDETLAQQGPLDDETPPVPGRGALRIALTDAHGSYRLVGVLPGQYLVEALHPDFQAASAEATVEVGRTTAVDLLLQPLEEREQGTVAGLVVTETSDGEAQPLRGARVELLPADQPAEVEATEANVVGMALREDLIFLPPRRNELVAYTDGRGEFVIRGVPPGTYVALAVKRGFQPSRQEVQVAAGEVAKLRFTLKSNLTTVYGTVWTLENGERKPVAEARVLVVDEMGGVPLPVRPTGPGLAPGSEPGMGMGLPRPAGDFRPTRPGAGRGNRPASRMWVSADDLGGAVTDERGEYELQAPAGVQVMMVHKEGYAPVRKRVELQPDERNEVNFELEAVAEPARPRLDVELRLEKQRYEPGDEVPLTLIVQNSGEQTVRLEAATSALYDFAITNEVGEQVWRWSDGKAFAMVISELVLGPGETKRFQEVWPAVKADGTPLSAGVYVAHGVLTTHPPFRAHPQRFGLGVDLKGTEPAG